MNLNEVRFRRIKKNDGRSSGASRLRRNDLFNGPVNPCGLLGRACQERWVVGHHSVHEVFDQGKVQVGVWGQKLSTGTARVDYPQVGRIQRVEVDLAVFADDAELIAGHARVPAHVDNGVHAAGKLHKRGRGIFDGDAMDSIRQQATGMFRLTEEKVHRVDAVRGDVVKRPAA